MLIFSIKRPEKPGILSRIFNPGQRVLPQLPMQQQQHARPPQMCACGDRYQAFCQCEGKRSVIPMHESGRDSVMFPEGQERIAAQFMEKHFYNNWLNQQEAMWPKGSICTMRMFPVVLERKEPPLHYFIRYFQEMRHLASWDPNHREPRAVAISTDQSDGAYFWVAPSSLRPLTNTERQMIADLQNQKDQGSSASSSKQEDDEGGGHGHYAG